LGQQFERKDAFAYAHSPQAAPDPELCIFVVDQGAVFRLSVLNYEGTLGWMQSNERMVFGNGVLGQHDSIAFLASYPGHSVLGHSDKADVVLVGVEHC